jgi:hypothetical protein
MARRLFSPLSQRLFYPAALISCLAGIALPALAQFETRATSPFPSGAYCIATGDFNNDGILDVVMTTDDGFSVALGNGDGTFKKAVTYHTQLSYSLAVADFNGDGNLDIVVANENDPSTVSVYLGNGDGTFKAPINSPTTNYSTFVVVGDFNGDGKPDIAVIDNPYISVLLGKGDGTFQPPSDNDSFLGAHWLAVADFNNDHKLDVVVTGFFGSSYSIGVLLGNGNGALQNSITQAIEYIPASVTAGDLNGDGNMDAILGYDLDGIAVFLGNGDGTLQPPVNYNTTGIGNDVVVVNDLNLDGKLDVAVPSTTSNSVGVDVFWGNGDGTLQPAQFFATTASEWPTIGDFNGDHLPDFAFGDATDGVTTLLNAGVVSFSPTTAPLTFPVQVINTSSKQALKLTNNGSAALSISSMKVSGAFQMSNTCGTSVTAGASCSISAVFRPKDAGTFAGLITIVDSASSKPQFIELAGSATAVKLSPASLNFGGVEVGTKSAPQTVTATNEGKTSITFTSVGPGGNNYKEFSVSGNCTRGAIAPGASCEMSVTFDPTKTGAAHPALYFDLPTGSIEPVPVKLSGTGT